MNLTPSQQEVIERIKTAYRYKHGLKDFEIKEKTYFISVSGTGDFL